MAVRVDAVTTGTANRTNTLYWHTRVRYGPWSRYERDVRVPRPLACPVCTWCGQPAHDASWHDPIKACADCIARAEEPEPPRRRRRP